MTCTVQRPRTFSAPQFGPSIATIRKGVPQHWVALRNDRQNAGRAITILNASAVDHKPNAQSEGLGRNVVLTLWLSIIPAVGRA